ncbi:MAG: 50S ribosomal protein L25 [Patescibacteria group bacterium]
MLTLNVAIRTEKKKRVKVIRRAGFLPGVVYGPKIENESLSISLKEFELIYKKAGESTLIELAFGGKKIPVIIQAIKRDPRTSVVIHADFYAVDLKKHIRTKVPIVFIGESSAVKDGAILVKVMKEIEIEALPQDLPHEISVSIESLVNIGDRFAVSSLNVPSGVRVRADVHDTIVIVEAPRAEEELVASAVPVEVAEVKTEQEIKKAAIEAKKKEEDAVAEGK